MCAGSWEKSAEHTSLALAAAIIWDLGQHDATQCSLPLLWGKRMPNGVYTELMDSGVCTSYHVRPLVRKCMVITDNCQYKLNYPTIQYRKQIIYVIFCFHLLLRRFLCSSVSHICTLTTINRLRPSALNTSVSRPERGNSTNAATTPAAPYDRTTVVYVYVRCRRGSARSRHVLLLYMYNYTCTVCTCTQEVRIKSIIIRTYSV